ncbi:MAG: hypothetical protein H0U10_08475, partial [Chloroflexia bacterium]|nr:hypothetical protein [Chloroflexia bacterium]
PVWGFYLALLLGFGSVEAMAKVVPGWRGPTLRAISVGVVIFGIVISRLVIGRQLGIDIGDVNQFTPRLQRGLYLQLVPDLLFIALPVAIAWVRFR